jgi:hypothetical protein
MQLPITDLMLLAGVAVLVFLTARARPAPMQNGHTIKLLLDQVAAISAERDHWHELALRTEARAQELERDCQSYRGQIRRMNEDEERRRRELR